jgi:hypothetical protein
LTNIENETKAIYYQDYVTILKSELDAKDALITNLMVKVNQITAVKDEEINRLSLENKNTKNLEDKIALLHGKFVNFHTWYRSYVKPRN